jgi:hypothetical protein
MPAEEPHQTSANSALGGSRATMEEAAEALRDGPIGAFILASIGVGLLFLGWLAFYFFLFLPRGSIG